MNNNTEDKEGVASKEELKKQLESYDFVRYTFTDINGVCRHKLIPARNAAHSEGVGIYSGIIACGPLTEEFLPPRVAEANFPNALLKPMAGTLHPVPWASDKYKTAQVLCETFWMNNKVQEAHPRGLARRQLARLEALGYKLMSAFETELTILKKDDGGLVFPTCDYCCTASFRPLEEFFMDVDHAMTQAGVDIECIHAEHAPSQFETILRPAYGISGADQAFILKHGLKDMLDKQGYSGSYMARLFPEFSGSGCHFNFSLWNMKTNENVFYQENGADGLSDVARWWTGGLVKHARAACALFNPTVNCYRRLHEPWAPDYDDWNIDDRMASFRVKNYSPRATYIENRMASALANPYIVMAVTIAAGLDGVVNKIEPPPKGRDNTNLLPSDLAGALDLLEQDTVLAEALGPEFIEWFLGSKREIDLVVLKDSEMVEHDAADIKAECHEYARLM